MKRITFTRPLGASIAILAVVGLAGASQAYAATSDPAASTPVVQAISTQASTPQENNEPATDDYDYIAEVRSLGVLNDAEMATLIAVEKEVAGQEAVINKFADIEELSPAQEAEINAAFDRLGAIYEANEALYSKITEAMTQTGAYDFELEEGDHMDEGNTENYLAYVKEMNVLTPAEFTKFAEVTKQIDALCEQVYQLNVDAADQSDDPRVTALWEQIDQLDQSISSLNDKIYGPVSE